VAVGPEIRKVIVRTLRYPDMSFRYVRVPILVFNPLEGCLLLKRLSKDLWKRYIFIRVDRIEEPMIFRFRLGYPKNLQEPNLDYDPLRSI